MRAPTSWSELAMIAIAVILLIWVIHTW